MKKKIVYLSALVLSTFISSAQSVQDARKLTDNEQFEKASSMYQQLIAANPANADLYYYYGDNLLSDENPDSANVIFQKGKTINAASPLIKIGSAKILLDALSVRGNKAALDKDNNNPELKNRYEQAQANVAEANKLIDEAVAAAATTPKDPTIYLEAAEAYIHYENKDLDKAKVYLDKANAINPNNIELNLLYGDLYAELAKGTLSAEYYNKVLDNDKTSARATVSKGKLYMRSTNYEGAAEEFLKANQFDPAYAPAYRELGEAYFKLRKLEKAKEAYKKFLELSNNCSGRIRYASFLYLSQDYSEAINQLSQVQQRCDSNNLRMLRIQAISYYELKDYEKGMNVIEHVFRLVPLEKRIDKDFEYYGKLLIAQNKDSLGIEQLQKAYALDPTRTDLLSEIANAWFKLKQYQNAIFWMEQKKTQSKDQKDIKVADYFLLGRAYFYNNQYDLADSSMRKVNEIQKPYASGWLWRARINSSIDSTSELGLAKPFYETYDSLATVDSANPTKYQSGLIDAYGYLAYYYTLKKDNEKSIFYLKKKLLLPLEPEDKKRTQLGLDQLEGRAPKGK